MLPIEYPSSQVWEFRPKRLLGSQSVLRRSVLFTSVSPSVTFSVPIDRETK